MRVNVLLTFDQKDGEDTGELLADIASDAAISLGRDVWGATDEHVEYSGCVKPSVILGYGPGGGLLADRRRSAAA
jgi:hypothetical protein